MKLKNRLLLALSALLFSLSMTTVQAQPSFVFTAIPDQDETKLKQRFPRLPNT